MHRKYQKQIEDCTEDFLEDLKNLVSVRSYRDLSTAHEKAPFGIGIAKAFQILKDRALEMGFKVQEEDGYAMDIRTGDESPYIGILCHIDTVEAIELEKWNSDPYTLTKRGGILYGRGVNDDKGPLLANLYAMKILTETKKLKYPIRLIVGGAEETTWECMEYYFARHPQPLWAYSPDGDFPVVNGEKGILQVDLVFTGNEPIKPKKFFIDHSMEEGFTIESLKVSGSILSSSKEFLGKRALSRHPDRGVSPLKDFLTWFEEQRIEATLPEGSSIIKLWRAAKILFDQEIDVLGLMLEDPEMGKSTMALTGFKGDANEACLSLDIRYTRMQSSIKILEKLDNLAKGIGCEVKVRKERKLLYQEKDSKLITTLKDVYESVTGDVTEVLTKGGASYARTLDHGVAFGPTFPGETANSHLENERLSISSIQCAMEIWIQSLEILAEGE